MLHLTDPLPHAADDTLGETPNKSGASSSQRGHRDSQGEPGEGRRAGVNTVCLGSSEAVRLQGLEDEPQLYTEASTDRRASVKVPRPGKQGAAMQECG